MMCDFTLDHQFLQARLCVSGLVCLAEISMHYDEEGVEVS